MRMMQQIRSPGVEHGEEADSGAEMLGIGGYGAQGFGSGLEENAIDQFLILIGDGGNRFGHGENDVEVRAIEEFGFALLNPLGSRQRLALGAMAIAAGVVSDALMATVIALFDMAA